MTADAIAKRIKRWNTAAWMDTSAQIAHPNGDIAPMTCNEFQREVSEIIEWCHDNHRPARIIILKPRRRGSSTVSVAAGYRRLQARRATGCIAGGAHFQGKKLFKMLEIYAEHDGCDPETCDVLTDIAKFKNGSEMDRITLANAQAGRAGGYQFLCITEMAFLSEEGVADAPSVVSGLIKTVQFVPDTIIILESTANGAVGDYYERWQKAISFEEFKKGRNGFVKVFYAWFQFDDLRMSPASEGIESESDYTAQEAELADKWKLDMQQVAWMRWSIREECNGDFDKFQEDYPFDPESAFRKSGRGRFDPVALEFQEKRVSATKGEPGYLNYNEASGAVTFVPCNENEATVMRFEPPAAGKTYLVSCDPATGDSQTSGIDPDSNAAGVMRRGYIDASTGYWVEPALAMRTMYYKDSDRLGNWWDTHILEEQIWRMQRYYGDCLTVTEVNKDRGIIELQKARGDVSIYARKRWNQRTNEETEMLGWETNERTREAIISNLAAKLTQSGKGKVGEGVDIRDKWLMQELKDFVVKANGRSEAAKGKHDDSVLMLAIGLYLIPDYGTAYAEKTVERALPPEIRRAREQYATQTVPTSYA